MRERKANYDVGGLMMLVRKRDPDLPIENDNPLSPISKTSMSIVNVAARTSNETFWSVRWMTAEQVRRDGRTSKWLEDSIRAVEEVRRREAVTTGSLLDK